MFGKDGFRSKGCGKASAATKERWRSDGCLLSTHQYEEKAILWHGNTWRHPSADELDVLLGFPRGFTAVEAVNEEARERLLGNTMHLGCIERLLQDVPTSEGHAPSVTTTESSLPAAAPVTPPGSRPLEEDVSFPQ